MRNIVACTAVLYVYTLMKQHNVDVHVHVNQASLDAKFYILNCTCT